MDNSPLNLEDLEKLEVDGPLDVLGKLTPEAAREVILIGGQALRIWGDKYLLDEMTGEEYSHLTSDDLDLVGDRHTIELCAAAWGGNPKICGDMDDHTPNSGHVIISDGRGATISIDFLDRVYNIDNDEVKAHLDSLITENGISIPILTPPICLKSRIHNLAGLHYNDEKVEREITRIKLAASATRFYIEEMLASGEIRKALKAAKYLIATVFRTKEARRVARQYNAQFLHALPERDHNWPEETRNKDFPLRLNQVRNYLYGKQKNVAKNT